MNNKVWVIFFLVSSILCLNLMASFDPISPIQQEEYPRFDKDISEIIHGENLGMPDRCPTPELK